MPQTAAYFRNQAQRLREIARSHQTSLSARLIEMASELEIRADELDKEQTTAGEALRGRAPLYDPGDDHTDSRSDITTAPDRSAD